MLVLPCTCTPPLPDACNEPAPDFPFRSPEAAGADDCWTHDVLGDVADIMAGKIDCSCKK